MDDRLLENIEIYNKYVMEKIKQIMEFDLWYEHTNGIPMPKEWYDFIKANAENQP